MSYDSSGNMLSRTSPLGHVETWAYDGMNDPTSYTDANGHKTNFAYDERGNLLSTEYPDENRRYGDA